MTTITYQTSGTCSQIIRLSATDDGILDDVAFLGGCNGNLKGICALVKGRPLHEVKARLSGITCGNKATSCPDQLARAIEQLEAQIAQQA